MRKVNGVAEERAAGPHGTNAAPTATVWPTARGRAHGRTQRRGHRRRRAKWPPTCRGQPPSTHPAPHPTPGRRSCPAAVRGRRRAVVGPAEGAHSPQAVVAAIATHPTHGMALVDALRGEEEGLNRRGRRRHFGWLGVDVTTPARCEDEAASGWSPPLNITTGLSLGCRGCGARTTAWGWHGGH